jgi:predicted amidohydrolase
MPTVAAAVLRVDKRAFGANADNRLQEFGLAVAQANSLLKACAGPGGIRVLVAPEYYFSGRGMLGRNQNVEGPTAMSRRYKHDLYDGLKKVSSRAGSLVIIAGSIFYRKTSGGAVHGYNVCPVLRNGRFLTKQYKELDDQNLRLGTPGATYNSKDAAPSFTAGGVRFGVDICADHAWHKLKDWAAAEGETIDIHIVVSEGTDVIGTNVAARAGGYVIHCDMSGTNGGHVKVLTAAGAWDGVGAMRRVNEVGVSNPQVNGVTTYIYRLAV